MDTDTQHSIALELCKRALVVRLGSFGVQRRLRVSFQQSRSVSSTLFDEDARNPTETNTEEWRSELQQWRLQKSILQFWFRSGFSRRSPGGPFQVNGNLLLLSSRREPLKCGSTLLLNFLTGVRPGILGVEIKFSITIKTDFTREPD